MNKADLLTLLRDGVTEAEWAALAAGGLRVSAFNRGVLLEMWRLSGVPSGEIDAARVRGLREVLEDYLSRQLPDAPEAWRWIVIASLYLTFIAGRPMHPVELLHIAERTENGRAVYLCPSKSDDPRTTCFYCVCRGMGNHPAGMS